jgi:anti-sigma factor RsiW
VSAITCQEVVALVTDYLDGALERDVHAALEVHLRDCEGCALYVEQMRTTARLAAAAELEQRPDSSALLEAFRSFKRSSS